MKSKKRLIPVIIVSSILSLVLIAGLVLYTMNRGRLEYDLNPDGESYSVRFVGHMKDNAEIVIPAEYKGKPVTRIAYSSYTTYSNMQSITISASIRGIHLNFANCDHLTNVYITDVAAWCQIDFSPDSNPSSHAENFYLNGELVTDLVIPDGVESIGRFAFAGCQSLTSITVPDSVTVLGNQAFASCENLTKLTLPDGVTLSENNYGICGGSPLREVTVPEHALEWVVLRDCEDPEDPYAPWINDVLETVVITKGEIIPAGALHNCTALTSVTLPHDVTQILDGALKGCTALSTVTFQGTVAEWQAIEKGDGWDENTPSYTVYCTDGTLAKDGTLISE